LTYSNRIYKLKFDGFLINHPSSCLSQLTTPPQAGGVCTRNYSFIFPLTLTLPQGEGIGGNPTASGWGIKKISIKTIK
jgi:hypothetical protein